MNNSYYKYPGIQGWETIVPFFLFFYLILFTLGQVSTSGII